jgi:hypothetical protein
MAPDGYDDGRPSGVWALSNECAEMALSGRRDTTISNPMSNPDSDGQL